MADQTFSIADITRAVNAGVLAPQDGAALESFLTQSETDLFVGGTVDGETPRLVRGFHDILISLGLIIGALGISMGLGSPLSTIVLAVSSFVLAIFLTSRMRLALPSTVLALLFTGSAGLLTFRLGEAFFISDMGDYFNVWAMVGAFAAAALAAGLFFRAFRVPIALAIVILSAAAALAAVLAGFVGQDSLALNVMVLVIAIGLFAIAVRFDLSDPTRRSTRSDYAFWIHLATAPVLMASLMGLLFGSNGLFGGLVSLGNADYLLMLVVLAGLALIAIALDRRALLVAGLGYLGYAIYNLLNTGALQSESAGLISVTLVIVSILVVSVGLGWQPVRRVVLTFLPASLRDGLPPVRS